MNKADKIIAAAKLLNDSCVFGYHECYDVYKPDIRMRIMLMRPDALKGVDGVRMSADGEKLIYQHDGGEITCFLNTVEAVRWREEHPKEAIE
jgi:hypothetical protein|nr:MAG TPA: hypothetical protein [Caudoviricetes sp.]